MKNGSVLSHVQDSRHPAQSPNTRLIAAARAVGFNWGAKSPYSDAWEDDKGRDDRTVTWVMDGKQEVEFKWAETDISGAVVAKSEKINFAEFRRRYTDLEWVKANEDHPISYMRACNHQHVELVKAIKGMPRQQVIRRGNIVGHIPENATDERRRQILKGLGISG